MANNRQDTRVRWWAGVALMLTVIFYVFRSPIAHVLNTPAGTHLFPKIAINVIMLAVVLGFYLRMLLECGFSRDVSKRGAWLILLIIVPVFSAFICYFVTRSAWYKEYLRGGDLIDGQSELARYPSGLWKVELLLGARSGLGTK